MSQWKGITRQWEEDTGFKSTYSGELTNDNWLPNLTEYTEEDESGKAKQKYILIDDIPEAYRDTFVSWAGDKVKQIKRTIEEDQGEVITDEIVKCVKSRVWKRWVKKNL